MTESAGNESAGALLFARIQQMVDERGVDIRQNLNGNALKLEFADGQRVLINFDPQTQNVWLAARSGGIEFIYRHGAWRAHDHSELFTRLQEIISEAIASNPLNARAPNAQTQKEPLLRPVPAIQDGTKPNPWLRNVLIVFLAASLGFWVAQRPNPAYETIKPNVRAQTQTVLVNRSAPNQPCEGRLPANGTIRIFPESGLLTDGPNDPEITLKNDHAYPLLFILTPPQTIIPSMSVLVHARQSTSLHLPIGQYDIMFSVGNSWCNPRIGFSDGPILKFDKSLTMQTDRPVQLTMQSSGTGMEDFQLFVRSINPEATLPPPTFIGDGSMEVQRQPNGHFYLPGTVENVPVTFMVDTGATVTSISSEIAHQAGIRNCKEVQFQTANGPATGCIAFVPHMTLGNFVLQNITVAVMPNMEINLLGANVLRNFQVSQGDSTMLIGKR